MITFHTSQLDEIFAHASETDPAECCGLIGGGMDGEVKSTYRLGNVAVNSQSAYEAAPEDLFAAQRQMRERGEQLLAIYHSHPRASEPTPSDTDVRLAYYPAAIYFIIGLASPKPTLRAFRISEAKRHWEQVEYDVRDG
ncbi:MAG: M67 family metallopeptidase [bacterium]